MVRTQSKDKGKMLCCPVAGGPANARCKMKSDISKTQNPETIGTVWVDSKSFVYQLTSKLRKHVRVFSSKYCDTS